MDMRPPCKALASTASTSGRLRRRAISVTRPTSKPPSGKTSNCVAVIEVAVLSRCSGASA